MIKIIIVFLFTFVACGVPPEDWKDTRPSDEQWMASMDASLEKWIVASQYLPKEKLQGLQLSLIHISAPTRLRRKT